MRRALLADGAGQATGVDAADPDPPAAGQPVGQVRLGAPVRRFRRIPANHHALGDRVAGLVVFGVDADIADMGKGEGDDLPGV